MKALLTGLFLVFFSTNTLFAKSWDNCIERYNKAKQFTKNIQLSYNYLKSTKKCLNKFRNNLLINPNPDYTIEAMDNNIELLDSYIEELIPSYSFANNTLKDIPLYININSTQPTSNPEYTFFKRFDNCNGIHAGNKIYTATHCAIKNSILIRNDLSYIKTKEKSFLKTNKLKLNNHGTFKYYSMSKEGMFYNMLLQEKNCRFYLTKNIPEGVNTTLDLADLNKSIEIRSDCIAIPSNSGGGVFQNKKLVAIISKTVFDKNRFLYSVIEPIISIK